MIDVRRLMVWLVSGAVAVGGPAAAQNLIENASTLLDSIVKAKPSAAKGKYLRSITVSSTMGPGIRIDELRIESAAKQ